VNYEKMNSFASLVRRVSKLEAAQSPVATYLAEIDRLNVELIEKGHELFAKDSELAFARQVARAQQDKIEELRRRLTETEARAGCGAFELGDLKAQLRDLTIELQKRDANSGLQTASNREDMRWPFLTPDRGTVARESAFPGPRDLFEESGKPSDVE
jgi:chromosome segregation ATPase